MTQVEQAQPRAAKRPKRASALTIRMTQRTRDALDAEAARELRSVSEVAEKWLDAASRGEAEFRERIGGRHISEAIEAMLAFAKKVEEEVGDPRVFLPARDALQAGWQLLIEKMLPYTPETPAGQTFRLVRERLILLCRQTAELMLANPDPDNEVTRFALSHPVHPASAYNALVARPYASVVSLLSQVGRDGTGADVRKLKAALDLVADVPEEIRPAIDEIRSLIPDFQRAYAEYMEPRIAAADKGEALAQTMGSVAPLERRS